PDMTSTNINIYQFLKKGKEAFRAENYGTATQLLTNVICIPELSSQHFEANDYLGRAYWKLGKLTSAAEAFERNRTAGEVTPERSCDVAEIYLQLVRESKTEEKILHYATLTLYWLKRSRSKDSTVLRQRKTGPLYNERGVKLLRCLFDILVKRVEGQPKQRGCLKHRNGESSGKPVELIDEQLVKELFAAKETLIDPHLHKLLARSLLRKKEIRSVADHALNSRYHLADNLEWNTFICENIDLLASSCPREEWDRFCAIEKLYMFALDNCVRLTLNCGSREECEKILKRYGKVSSRSKNLPEHNEVHQEIQARYNRHKAYFRIKFGALSDLNEYQKPVSLLPAQQESKTHLSFAFERLKRALFWGMPFTQLQHLTDNWSYVDYFICQRISDSFQLLATLLLCFDFDWLSKPDVECAILVNDDHATREIVFPSHKNLLNYLTKDDYGNRDRKELAHNMDPVMKMLKQIDKITLCSPNDLNRFLSVISWYIDSGKQFMELLKYWLPHLASTAPERKSRVLPKFKNNDLLQSDQSPSRASSRTSDNWQPTPPPIVPKKLVIAEEATLMDIETFLMILLIQRQEVCVTRLGATGLGQILYLAEMACWKPSASHQRFWNTVIAKYGRDDPERYVYTTDLFNEDDFNQAIAEIRGDIRYMDFDQSDEERINIIDNQRDLYLLLSYLFKGLQSWYTSRRVEALHCLTVFHYWDRLLTYEKSSFKRGQEPSKQFFILDETVADDAYRRFIPGYEKLSSAHGLENFAKTFYTDEKWSKVVQEVYAEEGNQPIHGLSDELSSQPTEGSIEDLASYAAESCPSEHVRVSDLSILANASE
ncbi:1561_t:CDS:10, partial [Paraglomus occultum]